MKSEKVVKKAAHFNKDNKEDKVLLEFIENNNINFSALSKQLITQYKNNEIITKTEAEKISKRITKEILEEYMTTSAIENVVRKVLLETIVNNNLQINMPSSNVNAEIKEEDVVDKAVNSYTDDDLAAMDF